MAGVSGPKDSALPWTARKGFSVAKHSVVIRYSVTRHSVKKNFRGTISDPTMASQAPLEFSLRVFRLNARHTRPPRSALRLSHHPKPSQSRKPASPLRDSLQRSRSHRPVLVRGCFYQRFPGSWVWIAGQLFCRRRPYRSRIVLPHRFERLVPHSCKRDKPNALLESQFRQFLFVFECAELFFDQSLAGAPFSRQHVVVNVITHVIVEQ